MAKKLLAFSVAAMLLVAMTLTASANTLVLDLSSEFAVYADTAEGAFLMKSGGAEHAVDGGALWSEKRANHYDNVDFVINAGDGGVTTGEGRRLIGEPNLPDGDYIFEVTMITFETTILQVATAREAEWTPIASAPEGAQEHTFTIPFTVKDNEDAALRHQGAMAQCKVMSVTAEDGRTVNTTAFKLWTAEGSATVDFAITSMKIYSVGGGEAANGGGGEEPATTTAAAGGGNVGGGNAAVESGDKEPDTGIGSVAVAPAIALVAAGAVVFSRKRK